MQFIDFVKKLGPVQQSTNVNGNNYDIPYNQSLSDYVNAGSLNNPNDPFSFLISTTFTGRYYNGDPIFEVTYKLPFNSTTDVGWNGWIIISAPDDEYIGTEFTQLFTKNNLKIENGWVTYTFHAIPSCTLKNNDEDNEDDDYAYDPYESDEIHCITEILTQQSIKDSYNITLTDDEWEELKESFDFHTCAPRILYNAIIGNVSESGLPELSKFLENSDQSLESDHLMDVESLDEIKEDFIEMFESDYVTLNDSKEDRFIFISIHED